MNSRDSMERMIVAPTTTQQEMFLISSAHAMDVLAARMERNAERGLPVGRGFTIIAMDEIEARALAELLNNKKTKLPKALYELRKHLKPKNFISMTKGGQG
jgi:hypothetical protein